MKYIANPVECDAFKIVEIGNNAERFPSGMQISGIYLVLEDGVTVVPTVEMRARMEPKVGDYWVIQEDGYEYLNPAHVFERKYRPATPTGDFA